MFLELDPNGNLKVRTILLVFMVPGILEEVLKWFSESLGVFRSNSSLSSPVIYIPSRLFPAEHIGEFSQSQRKNCQYQN